MIFEQIYRQSLAVSLGALVFWCCQLHGVPSEEIYLKRIGNHFLLNDYSSACDESLEALSAYPNSKAVVENRIKALARAGEERACLAAWHAYVKQFPDEGEGRNATLEEVAWGTINKTAASHSPPLRLMGILAAFLSQDARGIRLIKRGMRDPNILLRAATVKLVGNLHDSILKDEIERLIKSESSWKVRVEAIRAAGLMQLKAARPSLLKVAGDTSCHALERAAAISALVNMQKSMPRKEIAALVKSNRAGMRILACEVVAHLQLNEDIDLLLPLLNDHSSEVRVEVLKTVGALRTPINTVDGHVVKLLSDPDPLVAITAAWVVTLSEPPKGLQVLEKFLFDKDEDSRRTAAAALVATGHYGIPLAETVFMGTDDPYVKLNLALGLIGQRRQTEAAAEAIFSFLWGNKELLMEKQEGSFTLIAPSTIKHDDLIPNAPEAVNQKTRLMLLNILAVLKHPGAQKAVKLFLKEKKWGITGMAAAVLLTEGDDQALDIVKGLLGDPDPSIRLEAAIVLALWGAEEEALAVLLDAYPRASFDEKEKIIEGIGRVGSRGSLPFLTERLGETHQSLRLIAAAGIVQILYQ